MSVEAGATADLAARVWSVVVLLKGKGTCSMYDWGIHDDSQGGSATPLGHLVRPRLSYIVIPLAAQTSLQTSR